MSPLLVVYLLVVGLLSLHGLHRVRLLWTWWRTRHASPPVVSWPTLPFVTVQLPVYNERDVVGRLVASVAALDWPADRLEIQLLDDSTDDTAQRAEPELAAARARGIHAVTLRRPTREGFKAGALAFGLQHAQGELLAVFDADFVPPPDFLRRIVPHLGPGVGMAQARWGHLNATSPLTRAQATLLDGHFVIEHAARNRGGAWFNFNGTAGVWRRACIEAAGGWQHDTLTEDLDLSYRAQLAGWRFVYVGDLLVPAELPDTMAAFLAQQHRWAKGSVETFRKLARRVATARAPLRVRAEALAHLGANFAWPLAVLLGVLLPWVVWTRGTTSSGHLWLDLPAVGLSAGVSALFYRAAGARWRDVPGVLTLAVGIAPRQALATLEGLWGRRTPFVRTPKNGGGKGSYAVALGGLAPLELALAALQVSAMPVAVMQGQPGSLPFLLLFAVGFGRVGAAGLAARLRTLTLPSRRASGAWKPS